MVRLAQKAFHPGRIPFPLLHVDTGYKFPEMYQFRDDYCREIGANLVVYRNEPAIADGTSPYRDGTVKCCAALKTQGLLQALAKGNYDAAFGGARRDEEKSRAKERIFSFRDRHGQWDPKNQRPELWSIYNARVNPGESIRVFPLSNWTELDIWHYIHRENIPIVPMYFAEERPVIVRGDLLIPIYGEQAKAEGPVENVWCRFRTLGCHPCTGAIRSRARLRRRDHRGDDGRHQVRTHHPRHRPRPGRQHGTEEAGRVLLEMDVHELLRQNEQADLLRFSTAGSVDDGKSTLIGRLLADCKCIYDDQLAAVHRDSARLNREEVDLALLTDGLKAEREQGITIDVAYRYFSTPRRRFIIADTPGHEQYTRNMATGASTADLAVVLVDARHGVVIQSRRHAFIAALLGIPHLLVAVNKMDLVGYSQQIFEDICRDFRDFAAKLGVHDIAFIPMSAPEGRQRGRPRRRHHALVRGRDLPPLPRERGDQRRPQPGGLPLPGAVRQPPHLRLPRLLRHRRLRYRPGRRQGGGPPPRGGAPASSPSSPWTASASMPSHPKP